MNSRSQILIIGIDGGDWRFIDRLVHDGRMPNISRLLQEGTRAMLNSTYPPITPVAWTSIITGLNPGKHGIFAWEKNENDAKNPVTSKDINGVKLWSYLDYHKKRMIVNGLPLSYPPEKIQGCMISGWDTPDGCDNFIYPPEMNDYITDHFGRIRSSLNRSGYTDFNKYKNDFFALEEERATITRALMELLDWDLTFHLFCHSDHFNHAHIGGNEQDVMDAYTHIDELIGKFLDIHGDGTTLLVSDHGSKRYRKIFYVNRFLLQKGYLRLHQVIPDDTFRRWTAHFFGKKNNHRLVGKIIPALLVRMWQIFPRSVKKILTTIISRVFSLQGSAFIDTESSRFYSKSRYGDLYSTCINDDTTLQKKLIEELQELKDDETGERLINKVIELKNFYHGEFIDQGPDLYISFTADDIQAYPDIRRGDKKKTFLVTGTTDIGGDHSETGIFLVRGNGIKKNFNAGILTIVDIFPIIAHLLHLPIPGWIDGTLPKQIFSDNFLSTDPPCFIETIDISPTLHKELSEQEQEVIKSKLSDLGYL